LSTTCGQTLSRPDPAAEIDVGLPLRCRRAIHSPAAHGALYVVLGTVGSRMAAALQPNFNVG